MNRLPGLGSESRGGVRAVSRPLLAFSRGARPLQVDIRFVWLGSADRVSLFLSRRPPPPPPQLDSVLAAAVWL